LRSRAVAIGETATSTKTHLRNFLCEERGNSFADSDPYCRWRSTLIIEVMQLDQSGHNFGCVRSRGDRDAPLFVGSPTMPARTAAFRGASSSRRLGALGRQITIPSMVGQCQPQARGARPSQNVSTSRLLGFGFKLGSLALGYRAGLTRIPSSVLAWCAPPARSMRLVPRLARRAAPAACAAIPAGTCMSRVTSVLGAEGDAGPLGARR
jgi:hypothetical protein